jgi:DNA-binding transcriptional LysR family regulator
VHEEPVILAVPDNHPFAAMGRVALADLADEPIIMIPRSQEPVLFDYYTSLCADAGFSPKIVHEVNRITVAVGLVAGGLGVTFVPSSARHVAHSGVAYVELADPHPHISVGVVWRAGPPSPLLRSFLSLQPWLRNGPGTPRPPVTRPEPSRPAAEDLAVPG